MANILSKLFKRGEWQSAPPEFTVERDTRIPYQVYETIQKPAAQRQRWVIYIGLVLLVIVFAVTLIERRSQNQAKPPQAGVNQAEQTLKRLSEASPPAVTMPPATTSASGTTNDAVVNQPQ